MKKIFIMLALMAAVCTQAQVTEIKFQDDTYLLQYFDLSAPSGDTSFVFRIMVDDVQAWSINFGWSDVVGVGLVSMEVTNFDELTNFIPYVDDMSTIITGATGSGAWEDNMWSWKYFRITVEKGTLSAGYLSLKINLNK